MADALLSPAVGGVLHAASAGTVYYCSRKIRQEGDDRKIPLMGVLGAFVFAAQMINFSIPGTGSSGHLGGGLLLTLLLGPHAAFLVIASVLVVQALFFGDGGLLALGCNVFNLGFFPAFIAYPFIYRRIAPPGASAGRQNIAAVITAVVGLQMGAAAVVFETVASGISALPLATFMLLMLPIHLAIGVVEGVVTASVVTFVRKARPEVIPASHEVPQLSRGILAAFLVAALVTGGGLSWLASERPDGLEWSIRQITGKEELPRPNAGVHAVASVVQEKTAILPDYGFPGRKNEEARGAATEAGTSLSGIVGGIVTLVVAAGAGWLLRRRKS